MGGDQALWRKGNLVGLAKVLAQALRRTPINPRKMLFGSQRKRAQQLGEKGFLLLDRGLLLEETKRKV
jgi:hypothetical protein